MKVAVIGGGWAGLAAAVELTAAGVSTTLFEAGRVPAAAPGQFPSTAAGSTTASTSCLAPIATYSR